MKRKWIIALSALTFYTGISNVSLAQDTQETTSGGASVKSLFRYFVDSEWRAMAGFTYVDNNSLNPFDFNDPRHAYPMHLGFEKSLAGYSPWPWANKLSVSWMFYMESSFSLRYSSNEFNLIYSLQDMSDNILGWDWFSPALSVGISEVEMNQSERNFYKKFINLNATARGDFWIFDNVGIRLSGGLHLPFLLKGEGYYQYNMGLVYKIGNSKGKSTQVEEQPVSTYKRTKEEEDALIHLREHLNQ